MIKVGFVTDIDELMLQARQQRMAVRRAAWLELTAAVRALLVVVVRDARDLLTPARTRRTVAG